MLSNNRRVYSSSFVDCSIGSEAEFIAGGGGAPTFGGIGSDGMPGGSIGGIPGGMPGGLMKPIMPGGGIIMPGGIGGGIMPGGSGGMIGGIPGMPGIIIGIGGMPGGINPGGSLGAILPVLNAAVVLSIRLCVCSSIHF